MNAKLSVRMVEFDDRKRAFHMSGALWIAEFERQGKENQELRDDHRSFGGLHGNKDDAVGRAKRRRWPGNDRKRGGGDGLVGDADVLAGGLLEGAS